MCGHTRRVCSTAGELIEFLSQFDPQTELSHKIDLRTYDGLKHGALILETPVLLSKTGMNIIQKNSNRKEG